MKFAKRFVRQSLPPPPKPDAIDVGTRRIADRRPCYTHGGTSYTDTMYSDGSNRKERNAPWAVRESKGSGRTAIGRLFCVDNHSFLLWALAPLYVATVWMSPWPRKERRSHHWSNCWSRPSQLEQGRHDLRSMQSPHHGNSRWTKWGIITAASMRLTPWKSFPIQWACSQPAARATRVCHPPPDAEPGSTNGHTDNTPRRHIQTGQAPWWNGFSHDPPIVEDSSWRGLPALCVRFRVGQIPLFNSRNLSDRRYHRPTHHFSGPSPPSSAVCRT